jgi:hypothetical protein
VLPLFLYRIIIIIIFIVVALLEGVCLIYRPRHQRQPYQRNYHLLPPTTCLTSSSLLRHIIACCITAPFPPAPTHMWGIGIAAGVQVCDCLKAFLHETVVG